MINCSKAMKDILSDTRWRMKSDKMQLLQIADSDVFICFGAALTSFLMAGGASSDFKTISAYWHQELWLS